jgi:iron-sulfur cluster repair protein YtfE (RIC family)
MRSTQLAALGRRTAGEPEPDLTYLVLTHRAISQDLDRLVAAADELAPSLVGRQVAIRHYASALLAQVRAHRRCEDEILWPVIAAAAGQAIDLAPLTDDYEAIEAAVVRVSRALGVPGQSPPTVGELGQALGELRVMLDEHIADEERQVLPVMRRYLRAQTGLWCQRQACMAARPDVLRFRMPWLARYSRADEMSRVLAAAGWRARIALVAGRPGYTRLERRAFGAGGCGADFKGVAL